MNTAPTLLDLKKLSCSGSVLYDFVEKLNGTAHIKDTETGRYIFSNYSHITSLNCGSMDDLIGLNCRDILYENSTFYRNLYLNTNIVSWINYERENTEELDHKVKLTKHACQRKSVYIRTDSFIQLERTIKVPIPNQENKKIIGILTYSEDITCQVGLYKLFQLYKEFYQKKIN